MNQEQKLAQGTTLFRSVGRGLLLVELMVFLFMVFQTGAQGIFFKLAILQSTLQVLLYVLSMRLSAKALLWIIPIPAAVSLAINFSSGPVISFAPYAIVLVFYCFFFISNNSVSLLYILVLILVNGGIEYYKGVPLDIVLQILIPGLSIALMFFLVLKKLEHAKLDLMRRNQELEESQHSFKSLIENTNALIWSVDDNYCFLNGNTAFYLRFEFFTGNPLKPGSNLIENLTLPGGKVYWKELYDRALAGESFTVEKETGESEGKELTWEYSVNPVKLPNGKIYSITVLAKDISKKRIFEKRRQENETLLNGVLNNMPIGFQLFDTHGNLALSNQTVQNILGIEPNSNPDNKNFNVFHDNLMIAHGLNLVFGEVYSKGMTKHLELEMDFGLPQNTWATLRRKIYLELNIFPLYNEEKQLNAVVCLSSEITQRKQTEQMMLDQNKRLEEYAFTISHILRRPIANIISLSNLIQPESLNNPEDAQLVEFLNESTQQLDQILKELNQNITIKPDYFNEHKNNSGRR